MNAKQAAEKALNLGKQLQAVIDVGEVLNEIGDLEIAKKKAEEETKRAEEGLELAQGEQYTAAGACSRAREDFINIKAESKEHIAEATRVHDHLIAVAREERDKMIKQATESSNALVEKAKTEIHGLQNKRDGLLKEITNAQKGVTNLENQMKALKERLG